MSKEIEYKILKNEMILEHLKAFNWKKYFLRTFLFLLILNLIIFILFYRDFSTNELLLRFGISLVIIIFVCFTLTPIMINWYSNREKRIEKELNEMKKGIALKDDRNRVKSDKKATNKKERTNS